MKPQAHKLYMNGKYFNKYTTSVYMPSTFSYALRIQGVMI